MGVVITAALLVAGALALAGPVGVPFGYRNYTAAQRSAARPWWRLYLAGLVVASLVGVASFAWVYTRGSASPWLVPGLVAVLLPVVGLQWKMHAEMGYVGWLDAWFRGGEY